MRNRPPQFTIALLACLLLGGIWGVALLFGTEAPVGPGLGASHSGEAEVPLGQELGPVEARSGDSQGLGRESVVTTLVFSGATHVATEEGSSANGLVPVRLLDRASGLPAQGVRVSILYGLKKSIKFSEPLGSSGTMTDETGRADVPYPGKHSDPSKAGTPLMAFQGGGYSTAVRWCKAPPKGHQSRATYFVNRSAEVHGRVTFAHASPGGRKKVRLRKALAHWPSGTGFYGSIHGEGWIGAGGEFRISDVPPGLTFDMEVVADGEVLWTKPAALELRGGEVREVNWNLAPATVRVHGIEQDHRAPAFFRVTLGPAPMAGTQDPEAGGGFHDLASADRWGVATFEGVLPGRWRATVAAESLMGAGPPGMRREESAAPTFVDFEVGASGGIVDVNLPLYRGAFIVGTISLGAEDDLSHLTLCAVGNGGTYAEPNPYMHPRRHQSPSCRRDGDRFRVGPLVPGEYELRLAEGSDRDLCVHPIPVVATGGDPVRVEIRRGGRLPLSVVDGATGMRPASVVTVRMSWAGGARDHPFVGSTMIEGLHGRPIVLHASTGNGKVAVVRHPGVQPGKQAPPLVLRVREPARLQLLETPDDRWTHISAFRFGVCLGSTWVRPGSTGELRVGAGELEIVYSAGGGGGPLREIGRGTLEVKPGEVAALTLPPG